jgi:hypothetical protein
MTRTEFNRNLRDLDRIINKVMIVCATQEDKFDSMSLQVYRNRYLDRLQHKRMQLVKQFIHQ